MFSLNKTIKIFFIVAAVGVGLYVYNLFHDDRVKNKDYANVPDMSAAYVADEKVAEANKKLAEGKLEPATVITHRVDNKKVLSLTFDGLPRKETADRLLDVLHKHAAKATFFAEGSNAALNPKTIEALESKDMELGNYTYIGLSKLETIPPTEVIKQLCMTQKVFEVNTNFTPKIFKAPKSRYDVPLLKVAAACGLESAVKTDVFLVPDTITSVEAAEAVVKGIKPGSIVSVVVNKALEKPEMKVGKIDDKPAFDKQPSVKLANKPAVKHEDLVEVTDRFLTACENQGVDLVLLKDMRAVRLAQPQEQAPVGKVALGMLEQVIAALDKSFGCSVACAAEKTDYVALQAKNNGAKLEPMKMVLTTEPAVIYCFAGFSRPASVEAVLDRLAKLQIHGTFFVDYMDIKKNPQLVQRIVNSGNELGIAIYSRKSSNFASICKEIQLTQKALKDNYGITTNIAKQPWGVVEDFTKEAAAAMGCQLIGQNINVVQSKHKSYNTANEVMSELFGKFVYSLGRGWILNFRMDFYDNPNLCADMAQIIKEHKIDNIAYWAFDDDPEHNVNNDSAYRIKGVGSVLANKQKLYQLPQLEQLPEKLRPEYNEVMDYSLDEYIDKYYIGNGTVNSDSNTLGFGGATLRHLDKSGIVHTNKPVVFFSFDDWGTDAPINQLLYVFRKHHVKATFFILAHNIKNNPNLLRAIAEDGHDIACHTYSHEPMARVGKSDRMYTKQTAEQTDADYRLAYEELARIVGDVQVDGRYSLTRMFRPPTLTISKNGFNALRNNGYTYIVSGSTSTHDYDTKNLYEMIDHIRGGLYSKGEVKKGAVFVMHMSDVSKYTARALDVLMSANEKKVDGDPTKFETARLSDYLVDGYDQSKRKQNLAAEAAASR